MKERVYLKERLFQPSSFPLEHNAERAKNSRADEQHREEKRHQPSRPLLEKLSSQVAPIQIGAKLGAAKSGTKISLVVEEDAMDHFLTSALARLTQQASELWKSLAQPMTQSQVSVRASCSKIS
tara:strand:+ start:149 stop:520 length:372 start_codon:yes stop_codon:yes gene_type:complete